MELLLTKREVEIILTWKDGPFWPAEERILVKLRRVAEGSAQLDLSCIQLQILHGWVEDHVGGHYGGKVVNHEELTILKKLEASLEV